MKSPVGKLTFLFGPFLLLIASLTWGLGNVLYNFLSADYPISESLFGVYLVSAVVILPFFRFGRIDNWNHAIKQLSAMTTYDITSVLAYGLSNPNDITAILALSIFFTPVLSYIIQGKQFYKIQLILIVIWSFVGMLFLVQPPILFFEETTFTKYNLLGYALAVVATFARSLLIILQNKERVDEMSMTFLCPVAVSILTGTKSFITKPQWDFSMEPMIIICVVGILYPVGTFCSFAGWAITDPMLSALVYQTQLVFTYIFTVLFQVETNTGYLKILGVFLVLSSVCTYQMLDNWQKNQHSNGINVTGISYKLLDENEEDGVQKFNTTVTSLTGSSFRYRQ